MKGLIILSIVLSLILVVGTIIVIARVVTQRKKKKQTDAAYYEVLHKQYLEALEDRYSSVEESIEKLSIEENQLKEKISSLDKEISMKEGVNKTMVQMVEDDLETLMTEKKKEKIERVQREVDEWSKSAQEAANLSFRLKKQNIAIKLQESQQELSEIQQAIQDFQEKRDTINKEILRARAIEEQTDFYTIHLDEDSKHDLQILSSISEKLTKSENLNKLIYDNYISKPVKELTKRVLEGKNPTGIYKITNLKTKEIYIGKSTNVADRWKNHVKAACGLSGVADSQFQRALKKYGIENFTWELLEETTKEKLTEREKYYINFYDTTHYGYNQRLG